MRNCPSLCFAFLSLVGCDSTTSPAGTSPVDYGVGGNQTSSGFGGAGGARTGAGGTQTGGITAVAQLGLPPVNCGDGKVDEGEACDDGNRIDVDDCTNLCAKATCLDHVKNGSELGVDCGGPCGACPAACDPPPAGISADASAAYSVINRVRAAMGVPCARMDTALNLAAERHCQYYAANNTSDPLQQATCLADAHVEVDDPACQQFVAAEPSDRAKIAGYTGTAGAEVMAFEQNGAKATQAWIDSVWHRTDPLNPWFRDFGYGNATECDTMDFGVGARTPNSFVAMYPYGGQVGVPTSFDGNEIPAPPKPATNDWPSGFPISVFLFDLNFPIHLLREEGGPLIDHVWVTSSNIDAFMYANQPLKPQTMYRAFLQGTGYDGPVTLTWTFTTQ